MYCLSCHVYELSYYDEFQSTKIVCLCVEPEEMAHPANKV